MPQEIFQCFYEFISRYLCSLTFFIRVLKNKIRAQFSNLNGSITFNSVLFDTSISFRRSQSAFRGAQGASPCSSEPHYVVQVAADRARAKGVPSCCSHHSRLVVFHMIVFHTIKIIEVKIAVCAALGESALRKKADIFLPFLIIRWDSQCLLQPKQCLSQKLCPSGVLLLGAVTECSAVE